MTSLLIVDDEINIRKFITANLRARDYSVIEASSGADALTEMQANRPTLVLLDIRLPDMDGWSVLGQMAAIPSLNGVPVIVFTGSLLPDAAAQEKYPNLAHALAKPVSVDELLEAVRGILGEE